jgi:hypothetical protein
VKIFGDDTGTLDLAEPVQEMLGRTSGVVDVVGSGIRK